MTEIVNEGRQAKPSTRATYREVFIQLREGPQDSESNGIGVCVYACVYTRNNNRRVSPLDYFQTCSIHRVP